MVTVVKKFLVYGRSYYGIEHASLDLEEVIHILELRNKKGELHIIKEQEVLSNNQIQDHINEKQHAYLIINNNQVLSKKVNEKLDLVKAVQMAFPNIKQEEFYFESHANKNNTFVNICRKHHVDEILKSYKDNKISILGFSLGNNIITEILPYYNGGSIETSNAIIKLKNNQILEIVPSLDQKQEEYTINGLSLNPKSVNAFSGILRLFNKSSSSTNNFSDLIHKLRTEFIQQKIFENSLKFSLGFLFTILLINFMIFTSFNNRIHKLSGELTINQQYEIKINQLIEEVNKKKKIVDEINSTESNQVTYYLDEISKSIPTSILLTVFEFQPINHNIKQEKEIKIQTHQIIIHGSSTKGEEFSDWIAHLESLGWIQEASVTSYGLDKKSVNEFELKIRL